MILPGDQPEHPVERTFHEQFFLYTFTLVFVDNPFYPEVGIFPTTELSVSYLYSPIDVSMLFHYLVVGFFPTSEVSFLTFVL